MKKMRHCWYCGDEIGIYEDRHCDFWDTCGKPACDRETREALREAQDEAHRRLDEDGAGDDRWSAPASSIPRRASGTSMIRAITSRARDELAAGTWADLAESAAGRIGGDGADMERLLFDIDREISRLEHALPEAAQ